MKQLHACAASLVVLIFCPGFVPTQAFSDTDVDVTARTSITYDDNITQADDNEINDWINHLNLGLALENTGRIHELKLEADIRQEIYFDNSGFNNTAENVAADYKLEMSEYDRLKVSDRFTHAEEPTSFDDILGNTAGRYSYYKNRINLEYEHDLSSQWLGKSTYSNEIYNVSREDLRDSILNQIGLEADYQHSSALMFLMAYDFIHRDYEPGNAAVFHRVLTGSRYYFTKTLFGDARGGVSFSEVRGMADSDSVDPYAFLGLTAELSETETVKATFQYQTEPARSSASVFTSWRLMLQFAKQLTERLRSNIGSFYGHGEYEDSNIDEQLSGMRSGLEFELTEHSKLFLKYDFTNKDSDTSGQGYIKNVTTLGWSVEF